MTRRACTAAAAVLITLVAVAGCGSASHGLSRHKLIARADAICRSIDTQAAAASAHITVAHNPDGPRQAFIKTALATQRIAARGLAELRVLRPSSEMAADWARFLADVQKENAAAHALLRAAETQNTIAAAETQLSQRAAELDLQTVSELDGFRVCGKAANA